MKTSPKIKAVLLKLVRILIYEASVGGTIDGEMDLEDLLEEIKKL